jgi:hypothetical protein
MGFGFGASSYKLSRATLARQAPAKQRRYTFGTHAQTCHVWAQQNEATHTGQSSDGRIRFEGDTIYSYGPHFPMARFTDAKLGCDTVVLVTTKSYSVSTTQHMHEVLSALHGLTDAVCIRACDISATLSHANNIKVMVDVFNARATELANPRKRTWLGYNEEDRQKDNAENRAYSLIYCEHLSDYCDAFAITKPDLDIEAKRQAIFAAFAAYNDPAKVAKREKAGGKSALRYLKTLQMALAHREGVAPPISYLALATIPKHVRIAYDLPRWWAAYEGGWWGTYEGGLWDAHAPKQRAPEEVTPQQWEAGKGNIAVFAYGYLSETIVRRKGDVLQTSRGAECPFSHAVKAFRMAQACRSKGAPWKTNGHKLPVGHFTVSNIEADGTLHAGCHTIGFDAMLRLAVREVPEVVKACFPVPACI